MIVEHARVMGATDALWPCVMREQILARAIGRVLAHEIGHFVLRTPRHAARGLMRAVQRADDLVAPNRAGLRLSAEEAARLLRAQRKGPAHAAGP